MSFFQNNNEKITERTLIEHMKRFKKTQAIHLQKPSRECHI